MLLLMYRSFTASAKAKQGLDPQGHGRSSQGQGQDLQMQGQDEGLTPLQHIIHISRQA